MSQLVVSVAGAAIGFAIGGPVGAQWGWMAGTLAGSVAFPPHSEGPHLGDLSVTSSAYGAVIPYLAGHRRRWWRRWANLRRRWRRRRWTILKNWRCRGHHADTQQQTCDDQNNFLHIQMNTIHSSRLMCKRIRSHSFRESGHNLASSAGAVPIGT